MEKNPRLTIFETLLGAFAPGHLLDLGAGHGKFSKVAHDLGWTVTSVDARIERRPEDTPGITWVQADVREVSIGEGYDVIAVLGLLYHLGVEDQLDLLRRCAHRPTIIDTHHVTRGVVEEGRYLGALFHEDLDAPTAAWGNDESFWPTEQSLVRMLHDAGYRLILQSVPAYQRGRTFWLCLPSAVEPDRLEALRASTAQALTREAESSLARARLVHALHEVRSTLLRTFPALSSRRAGEE